MTEPLFFDTDCISAFLWVGNENLLAQLYPGRIVIPKQVYDELSNPGVAHLKTKVDTLLNNGQASVMPINSGTDEYDFYRKLVSAPDPGHKIIGGGEAAAIALAKSNNGILASNNLRDISGYVAELGLTHVTTGDILKEALGKGLVTESQGNTIWSAMLKKRRKLGYPSFSDFLADHP